MRGVVAASVTPFTPDRDVDGPAVARLIEYYRLSGLAGAFINSSSGEYFSMTPAQREKSITAAVKAADGRFLVLAGISEDHMGGAAEMGRRMAACGADIAVAMPPRFYNYGEDELYAFFTGIADRISIPLLIYNHMTRLNNKLSVGLLCRLSEHPNICGVKDTHNDATRLMTLLDKLNGREDFIVYAGGDAMAGFSALMGGYMLNALCAVDPKLFLELQRAGEEGDVRTVMALQQRVNSLMGLFSLISRPDGSSMSLFCQSIKGALKTKGLCGTETAQLGYDITCEEIEKIREFLGKTGA
jgi:4-hydroxy-tetrahydrodipicolinate synthase